MFRRTGDVDRVGESFWTKLAADVLGPLTEILWRMFALMFLGAAIVPVLRGQPWDDLLVRLAFLVGGLAILALLGSQIVRTTYRTVVGVPYRVRLVICPVAAPFFLVDAAWLAFGATWLAAPVSIAPDPAYDVGGPAIVLTVSAALLGLRTWSRLRPD